MPDLGPQYARDSKFTACMRRHQSWYRANVLGFDCGTGPLASSKRQLGNMLKREHAEAGYNFLTPEIFALAQQRIAQGTGTVDAYRLLHNMLSSQPMCFNLFGPLALDLGFASRVMRKIVPGLSRVVRVMIEYAPEPASEFLDDRTAFDAYIEFEDHAGQLGFVGVETKLTEPFSQKRYDRPAYRLWTERADSPWPTDSWSALPAVAHNQLWRDHLLAIAMRHHRASPYASGLLMLVRHPMDFECSATSSGYCRLLNPNDRTFIDCPLDQLIGIVEGQLQTAAHRKWVADFRRRYLQTGLSEAPPGREEHAVRRA